MYILSISVSDHSSEMIVIFNFCDSFFFFNHKDTYFFTRSCSLVFYRSKTWFMRGSTGYYTRETYF